MSSATPPPTPSAPPPAAQVLPQNVEVARISSETLLAGALEIQIEHRGALYRLRQTSLGKLILTK